MIDITINDKQYSIPQSFNEMTLGDYVDIFDGVESVDSNDINLFKVTKENEAKILAKILKEDEEFVLNMPLPLFESLMHHISFIYSIESLEHKNEIKVNDKRYKVPSARELTLRQWIDIDVIANEKENKNRFIDILSVLLNEIDNGKVIPYDGKYEELSRELSKVKCDIGLGIVYHFFLRGYNLKKITQSCLRGVVQNQLAKHTNNS